MKGTPLVLLVTTAATAAVNTQANSFGGYECTDNCAGHIYGGNSLSFIEGCEAYALGLQATIETDSAPRNRIWKMLMMLTNTTMTVRHPGSCLVVPYCKLTF